MFKQFRNLEPGEFIVIGGDCSAGGIDRSCCQFISKTKLDVPLVYHTESMATTMTNDIYPVLNNIFDFTGVKPIIAYERNNGGSFEMERLATLNRDGKFDIFKMPTMGREDAPEAVRYGWDTNTATRSPMLSQLKDAIDKRLLGIYDHETVKELYSFIVAKTSTSWKAQAEKGAHDDLVISLGIAWQLYQMCEAPTPQTSKVATYRRNYAVR